MRPLALLLALLPACVAGPFTVDPSPDPVGPAIESSTEDAQVPPDVVITADPPDVQVLPDVVDPPPDVHQVVLDAPTAHDAGDSGDADAQEAAPPTDSGSPIGMYFGTSCASHCPGCCTLAGQCLVGTEVSACGAGGATCLDCNSMGVGPQYCSPAGACY